MKRAEMATAAAQRKKQHEGRGDSRNKKAKEEGPKQQSRRKGAHALRRRALMAPAKNLDEAIDRAAGLVKDKQTRGGERP